MDRFVIGLLFGIVLALAFMLFLKHSTQVFECRPHTAPEIGLRQEYNDFRPFVSSNE